MHRITRITVTIEAAQPVAWPHFAGSTLRGAFGRALRQKACVTAQAQCGGCPLRQTCAYGAVFDPAPSAQPVHPSFRDGIPRFLVQAPALGACRLERGQTQSFVLVLLPGAQSHLHMLQHCLTATVEQELMHSGAFKLVGTNIAEIEIPNINELSPPLMASAEAGNQETTLRWLSPLRLQVRGKPIFNPLHLDAGTLVRSVMRRYMQWCQLTGQALPDTHGLLEAADACHLDNRNLYWHDIQRHSSTQNQKLPLGGLIGSAQISGPSGAMKIIWPLLQLGEQLHIGKETVMGLGHYQLSDLIDT